MADSLTARIARIRSQTVGDIPRRSARRRPDKTAIIDGEVNLTFADLDDRVNRVAAALWDNGFRKGDRIALLSHNCWQYAVLAFATARAGVVLVPINFMLGPDEIGYILDHSGVTGLIVEDTLAAVASEAMARDGHVDTKVVITAAGVPTPAGWHDFAGWLEPVRGPVPTAEVDDDDVIRLMYTSGTNRDPKASCTPVAACSGTTSAPRSPARCPRMTSRFTRCRCTTARSWTTS